MLGNDTIHCLARDLGGTGVSRRTPSTIRHQLIRRFQAGCARGSGGCVGHDQVMMTVTRLAAEVRHRLADAELTYPEVGATTGDLPDGYHHLIRRVPIGRGRILFIEAGEAVQTWQVQVRAGLRVSVSSPVAIRGTVLILGLGIGRLQLSAPCRVVYTVDESRRRGFAYGTLAGHPECGEEAFVVEHHDDDTVSFGITAFSRPSGRLAKLAGPLGRYVQDQVTNRYLRTLSRLAR